MNASIGFYIIFAGLVVLVLGYGAFELFVGRKRRAELARMASAAENTSAAVLILDHDAVIEWANGALTSLTGYAVEEAIGKTPAALLLGGGQTSALKQRTIGRQKKGLILKLFDFRFELSHDLRKGVQVIRVETPVRTCTRWVSTVYTRAKPLPT